MRSTPGLVAVVALVGLTGGCAGSQQDTTPTAVSETSIAAQPTAEPTSSPEPAAAAAPTAAPEAAAAEITITDFAFTVPASVAPGAEITVTNEDMSFHTVTADDGSFDVGARQGEPVTFTAPTEPGEYAFHCGPHPEMVAVLVVG